MDELGDEYKKNYTNLKNFVIDVRGSVLEDCTLLERLIYSIIRNYSFDSPEDFDNILKLFVNGSLRIDIQLRLLDRCIKKLKTNIDVESSNIDLHINSLFIYRNMLAHWMLDTSEVSMNKFKSHKVFYLIERDKSNKLIGKEEFNAEKCSNILLNSTNINSELIVINKQIITLIKK